MFVGPQPRIKDAAVVGSDRRARSGSEAAGRAERRRVWLEGRGRPELRDLICVAIILASLPLSSPDGFAIARSTQPHISHCTPNHASDSKEVQTAPLLPGLDLSRNRNRARRRRKVLTKTSSRNKYPMMFNYRSSFGLRITSPVGT
jgi:hypothetical protein